MLRVTVDLYSGKANPCWQVPADIARRVLRDAGLNRSAVALPGDVPARLGYRSTLGEDVTAAVPDAAHLPEARQALAARLLEEMARSRPTELERGVSLVGPHRDDLVLSLGDLPARGTPATASPGRSRWDSSSPHTSCCGPTSATTPSSSSTTSSPSSTPTAAARSPTWPAAPSRCWSRRPSTRTCRRASTASASRWAANEWCAE